ncbi:hypothetical protein [Cerasicoccus frondis]|uniref:hypothetical protein n=1 Tax=Cerasicoccus frondis TaxID=490090 RepID=UPI00285249EE|nr:hypothetical protein [Cerasicoccus frondis]
MREGKATLEAQADFRTGIQGASFLFDEKISRVVESIWERAIDLETKQFEMKDLPVGEERSRLAREIGDLKKSLNSEFKNIEFEFRKFLDLGKSK